MTDHNCTTVEIGEIITNINIKPSLSNTADFHFGKYYVNLDISKSCCEIYELFINGYKYNKEKNITIRPSSSVTFTFGEKTYYSGRRRKNTLQIKFSGGDRIRVNRIQYCNPGLFGYAAIYTRGVYLEKVGDDNCKLLGFA